MTASSLTDPGQHVFWLTSRATGIVAMVLVSLGVTLGLLLSGRILRQPGASARLKTMHEAVTLTGLGAITLHGLLLLGDGYLRPGLAGIALPFALRSQPVWTGLGIIGGWLGLALGLSYYVRRWIGVAAWRRLHRWTLLAYCLALVHTIGSGTDAGSAWFLVLLAAITIPPVAVGLVRLGVAGRDRRNVQSRDDANGVAALVANDQMRNAMVVK
jgi:sulfoxide reductase heme-binding subunit YedZ